MATAKNNKKGKKINTTIKKVINSEVKEIKKETKKNYNLGWLWVLIGIVLPPVGIILYFIWKNKRKEDALKAGKAGLIALCIWAFVGISFILSDGGSNNNQNTGGTELKTVDVSLASDTIKKWYNDLDSGAGVVTVIASSTCPHCQNYKPIITDICEKEKIKLYFFESDQLSQDDYTILTNSINLQKYEGYVPYTFIVKDRNFVLDHTGEQDESGTRNMLTKAGLLAN